MKLTLEIDAKTREGAVAALRTAIKRVQEYHNLTDLNEGGEIGEGAATADYVLKWKHAPVPAQHQIGTNVPILKGVGKKT